MFVFAKACPYLPALITIVQNSWQSDATKLAQAGLSAPYCLIVKKNILTWDHIASNAKQNAPKCVPQSPI